MKYDIYITFNDSSDPIHTLMDLEKYLKFNTDISNAEMFTTVTDTDGIIRQFQISTIKSTATKQID